MNTDRCEGNWDYRRHDSRDTDYSANMC